MNGSRSTAGRICKARYRAARLRPAGPSRKRYFEAAPLRSTGQNLPDYSSSTLNRARAVALRRPLRSTLLGAGVAQVNGPEPPRLQLLDTGPCSRCRAPAAAQIDATWSWRCAGQRAGTAPTSAPRHWTVLALSRSAGALASRAEPRTGWPDAREGGAD
jgi:hypothetical protein